MKDTNKEIEEFNDKMVEVLSPLHKLVKDTPSLNYISLYNTPNTDICVIRGNINTKVSALLILNIINKFPEVRQEIINYFNKKKV